MQTYLYTIDLHLAAPVLSQLSGARAFGLDTAALRGQDERPALPGSLVRGNLRQSWEYFAACCAGEGVLTLTDINAWLGEESPADSGDRPRRARLHFAYEWLAQEPGAQGEVRHRIQIDKETGTVARGALQVVEQPFAPGTVVKFSGTVRARLEDESKAAEVEKWLRKGLEFVPALGALKGTGFGRIERVEVNCEETAADTLPELPGPHFGLSLKLDRPFCFARPHSHDSNRFESEDFIPGAALRGALARRLFDDNGERLKKDSKLAGHFDKLHIRHALPACDGKRPLAIPLSLVSAPERTKQPDEKEDPPYRLYDVAFKEKPGLIHGRAPAFQPDWKDKDWQAARKQCDWPEKMPARRIEVHTAIDTATGTADEGKLFSLESVVAGEHEWLTEVCLDLPESECGAVLKELRDLLAEGLDDLGKTGARAEVMQTWRTPKNQPGFNSPLALVLQTPARLLPNPYGILSTNDGEELKKRYAEIWHALSGGALVLSHFYAAQRLAGGNYVYHRFWAERGAYNPELLTEAGSVFVFEVKDREKADTYLDEWLQFGLPQPDGREAWDDNPFIRVNGYGEVRLLPEEWDLEPNEEAWDAL